jgi:hypothetical protein
MEQLDSIFKITLRYLAIVASLAMCLVVWFGNDLVFIFWVIVAVSVSMACSTGFGFGPMEYLRTAWRAYRLSRRGVVVEARIRRVVKGGSRERKWPTKYSSPGQSWKVFGVAWRQGYVEHYWVIETQGVLPGTGRSFECTSNYLPEHPSLYIAGRETLPVLVDPQQPECNLLIAEFLPLLPDFGLRARADAIWKERQAGGNAMA